MTFDRTSGTSFGVTLGLHAGVLALLALLQMGTSTPVTPMLIEVTLAGNSAPHSTDEGVKKDGEVISPSGDKDGDERPMTAEELKAWRAQKKQEIIKALAESRGDFAIGASKHKLRAGDESIANGRGAGEIGQPGSPQGTLSLSGAIAARGYKEPDFSLLKSMITEETQLRLLLLVSPEGEVKKAALLETSGYPYVDQKAIELGRKIEFDPLPANWKQVDQQGVLTVKLKL